MTAPHPEPTLRARKLDPGAARVIALMRQTLTATGEPTPEQARAAFRTSRKALAAVPVEIAAVENLSAPGPGGEIPLRLYRGIETAEDETLPALLFFHSGGWVVGDLDTHDGVCRQLALLARCIVVAVDYRLAPEHKFPAATEDALAALDFVRAQAAQLGVDEQRIAVGGDSAGGNLAAVLALMARDAGYPPLVLQALIYPATDFHGVHRSQQQLAQEPPLTAATLNWTKAQYLRNDADRLDWRASPLLAEDLSGLAPAFIVTCGCDPLEDEGRAYSKRLHEAGVTVTDSHFAGQIHGFITMGRLIPQTTELLAQIAGALDAAFHRGTEQRFGQ
ncbi:alpha/beta hydrolase [Pseudomonas cichorii]|uniref:alpha/beta hydrolase n=1 Tax=Pseudomonas cichorii TaxID=36746 RepID=UPI001C8966C7|nr:alpha/beta hydrolase [Pseudomonas cichorii]MBX8494140.1 alpha/beta hydrolase [Pseudomonas cichorii]